MAKIRATKRLMRGGSPQRPGRKRVTVWLSSDAAKRLKHVAIERDVELGVIVEDFLGLVLGPSHWSDRSTVSPGAVVAPRIAETPGEGDREGQAEGQVA